MSIKSEKNGSLKMDVSISLGVSGFLNFTDVMIVGLKDKYFMYDTAIYIIDQSFKMINIKLLRFFGMTRT